MSEPRSVVLIVDDERAVLDALGRTLRREPYEVVTTESPQDALARLERGDVSLLVADERMPAMSGTELLRSARARHPEVGRAILTGFADVNALSSAVNEVGIHRYIPKPWDEDSLKETLRGLLHEHEEECQRRGTLSETERRNHELGRMNRALQIFLGKQTHALRLCQEVLDRVTVPAAVFSPLHQHLSYVNKPFLNLVAGRRSSLIGTPIEEVLPPSVCERLQRFPRSAEECTLHDVKMRGQMVDVHLALLLDDQPDVAILIYR